MLSADRALVLTEDANSERLCRLALSERLLGLEDVLRVAGSSLSSSFLTPPFPQLRAFCRTLR